jgi:hypothetical protein
VVPAQTILQALRLTATRAISLQALLPHAFQLKKKMDDNNTKLVMGKRCRNPHPLFVEP